MKLIQSVGPNPQVVKMFIAEKGVDIAREEIDIMAGANRQPAFLARNPGGGSPALEMDNGQYLAEITAICEYIEEKFPASPLIGTTAEERAETRMWVRRIDLGICEPMANGFRYSEGLAMFKSRMTTFPDAAPGLKQLVQEKLGWLDGLIAGRTWICGDRFTLADILLFCFLSFGAQVGQPMKPGLANLEAWKARVAARPSAGVR